MARMIKSTSSLNLELSISTIFENGDVKQRIFKVGDIVEALRYVEDEAIKIVSGRITAINYTVASRTSWNKSKPADTMAKDLILNSITIDNSEQYASSLVTVPLKEIVEWDEDNAEGVVKRMMVEPSINLDLTLAFSDNSVQSDNIKVGDTYDHVVIIDPNNIGVDITGKFEVIAFAYAIVNRQISVTGLALQNLDTGVIGVYDLPYVIGLNEVYTYMPDSLQGIKDALTGSNGASRLSDGDTLVIATSLDNSDESGQIQILEGKNLTIQLDGELITANSKNSNLIVQNAEVTFTGEGTFKAAHAYDSSHSTGVVGLYGGSKVTFDGPGIDSVLENANDGQFGITAYSDAEVVFNKGDFKAGWQCYASNGNNGNAPTVHIHGGRFISEYDYAIYKPDAGELYIDGDAYISGLIGAIAVNRGRIEISGNPTIVTKGADSPITDTYSDGTSTMEVEACLNLNAKYGDIVCRISGGKFYGGDAVVIATGSTHNVDLKISGGAFSTPISNSDWLEEGYVCKTEPNEEGLYEVVKAEETESVG